ncbi:MAG: MFS transporter [Chloroflexi bacterium]|nr:MFS transporter [Chloroflexota bacterium]
MFSVLRALTNRTFVFLWSGQTVSRLGDSLYDVALAWWVLEKSGSAVVMGTVLIFRTVPMLAFALAGGVLVDRFPRLRLMLISDAVRGAAVGAMALLAFGHVLEVWHLYAISLLFGLVDAIFPSAYRAALPEVIAAEALPSANSLTDLSGQLSGIAGPAIGAFLVAAGGSATAFALDGLSFFVSALCLVPVQKLAHTPRPKGAANSLLGDVRAGLAAVFGTAWIWIIIAVATVSNLTYAGPMGTALPFLIRDHLKAGVSVLGLFYSFNALGAVCGAIWIGHYATIRRRGLKIFIPWLLLAGMVVVMGLAASAWVLLAAGFVIGLCNSVLGLVWLDALQQCVPRELQGRVSSVDYLGS